MNVKHVIESIIVLVIALLIFSYVVDSSTKYKVNKFFSDIQNEFSSNIEKIPTPVKINCKDKASELVPPYLILPNDNNNFWKDETTIGINNPNVRKGSGVGENINKLYFDGNLTYSKEIISKDGAILGTRSFIVHPTIEKYENKFTINHTFLFHNETRDGESWKEARVYVDVNLFWTGFDDEVKNIFKIDELNVTFVRSWIESTFTINKKNGEITFRQYLINWSDTSTYKEDFVSLILNKIENNPPPYYYSKHSKEIKNWWGSTFETYPLPIIDSNVYKIKDFEIYDCKWV
ncbi:hypothetical protein HYX05_03705 [Candidatus Woesearchaeota archaeon]|nr:hypothetical protein [Candidatus Woesearchaeota archaeon]